MLENLKTLVLILTAAILCHVTTNAGEVAGCVETKSTNINNGTTKVSCDRHVDVYRHGSKFTDIHCKLPHDDAGGFQSIPIINVANTKQLSLTDCVKGETNSEEILKRVQVNDNDIYSIHLNYSNCDLDEAIEVRENLLGAFNKSLQNFKVSAHGDCLKRINFTPKSLSAYDSLEEMTLSNIATSGFEEIIPPPNLSSVLLQNVSFGNDNTIFSNKSGVERMDLINCRIENFTREFFKNIKIIDELWIERSIRSKSIPNDLFQDLQQLEVVTLINNEFESLLDGTLDANTELSSFNLSSKSLKALGENVFKKAIFLRELSITNSWVTVLPDNFIKSCTKITDLTLSHNRIEKIPQNFFANQKSIERLLLNNNRIVDISDGTFSTLKRCEVLDLSWNRLVNISDQIFDGMSSLNTILLNDNRISSLGDTVFLFFRRSETGIKVISLANNPLGSKNKKNLKQFESVVNLAKLNLRHTSLDTIEVSYFVDVADVDLSDNRIDFVKFYSEYKNLSAHTKFNLEGNVITCDCKALPFLQDVRKSKNSAITVGLTKCASPEDMEGKVFMKVDQHELVCPSDLCPESCDCVERPANQTLHIDCAEIELTEIPKMPELANSKLKFIELNIENNNITQFPANDTNFERVVKIFARNNTISSLVNLPPKIQMLDLRNNELRSLENDSLLIIDASAAQFLLSQNDWRCNCTTSAFFAFIKKHHERIDDIEEMRCHLIEKKFMDVDPDDFCFSFNILITISIAVCVGIVAVIGLIHRYQKTVKILLYTHGYWWSSPDHHHEDKNYDAFVIFPEQDIVDMTDIVGDLEDKTFKLCVYCRDLEECEFDMEQIRNAISQSRRVIIFVSENFVDSNWVNISNYRFKSYTLNFSIVRHFSTS